MESKNIIHVLRSNNNNNINNSSNCSLVEDIAQQLVNKDIGRSSEQSLKAFER